MKKYKTGLVLSGGGTRGFAHLGVIAALYEKGIQPDVIAGTSVGALVGAFVAAGKSPEEIIKIFNKGWLFKYTNLHLPVDGLLKLNGLEEVIQKEISYKNIEDLPLPFFVAVSNLNKGAVEYKSSGPLGKTVLASSSIPILFSPVEIDGQLYVDGGLLDNIPVKPVKNKCEQIVAVNISPINPREKFKNLIQIAIRTFYMSVNANLNEVKKYAAVYVEPEDIDTYDILSMSHAEELYELGYNSLKNLELPQ
ncbi:patatin [Mariniphaga sediminis]|uniref:Patatin n=1 Tax=Mariniphaga sediminis TaxID=1628158 RepID=A0A399D5C2_9BACT|nr:patatin-like phospholipase family protein [Mariniphaga sediminis]RIH65862.1 patatin [Mariniphaga sediminis]